MRIRSLVVVVFMVLHCNAIFDSYDLVSGDIVQIGQVGVVKNHLRKHSNHPGLHI